MSSRTTPRRPRGRATGRLAACLAAGALLAPGSALAASRGIEQVTPRDPMDYFVEFATATPNGDHVFWRSSATTSFETPDGGTALFGYDEFSSGRTAEGWVTSWLTPYVDDPAEPASQAGTYFVAGSDDGTRVAFTTFDAGVPQDDNGRSDLYVGTAQGVTLVSRTSSGGVGPAGVSPGADQTAGSADLGVVAFATRDQLVPADQDNLQDVYRFDGQSVQLISDGVNATATAAELASGTSGMCAAAPQQIHAVSADGQRVFFESGDGLVAGDTDGLNDVYVWDHGVVKRVSQGGGNFCIATKDGRYAFFMTSTAMAPDDHDAFDDLYRYSVDDGSVQLVSGDAVTSVTGGTELRGISPDGSHAFLATPTVLDPVADQDGGKSLYSWDAATGLHYISPIDDMDPGNEDGTRFPSLPYYALRSSDDGSVVAFTSNLPLCCGDTGNAADVYLYAGGQLQRISQGGDPSISARLGWPSLRNIGGIGVGDGSTFGHPLTADGGTVFFTTARRLLPDDHNSALDVYEYSGGQLQLVTPGDAEVDSFYLDSSLDGRDVFFSSNEPINGAAGATPFIYDARVGGGFPAPPGSSLGASPPTPGPGTLPSGPAPGSVKPTPEDNLTPGEPGRVVNPRSPSPAPSTGIDLGSHALAQDGTSVTVDVTVPSAGELSARLTSGSPAGRRARAARTVTLARGREHFDKAGKAELALRLTKRGRRELARHGRIRATLLTAFKPAGGPAVRDRVHVGLLSDAMTVLRRSLRVRHRRARVRLAVPAGGRLRVEIRAKGSTRLLARGRRSVRRGGRTSVTVRLTRGGRRALRPDGRLRGTLHATLASGTGATLEQTARVRVQRAGGHREAAR